jgi:uncharacterized protein
MQDSKQSAEGQPSVKRSVPVGRIVGMWRYPVKSLGGESVERAEVSERGLRGDRSFGIVDASDQFLLSAKRMPKLLEGSARLLGDDSVEITIPLGPSGSKPTVLASTDADVNDALSQWLGRAVQLRTPASGKRAHVEIEVDIDDPSQIAEFSTRPGLFHDGSVMHILTTESLQYAAALYPAGDWTSQRFRPNLLVEPDESAEELGFREDAWVGHTATVGDALFAIHQLCDRCVMVTRPLGELPADKMVLRTLHRHHNSNFGVKAHVTNNGQISVGDAFFLDPTIN